MVPIVHTDRLSTVFIDEARYPIFVINAAGRILRTNQRAGLQLGLRKRDLRGKDVVAFLQLAGGVRLPAEAARPEGSTTPEYRGMLVPVKGDPLPVEVVVQVVDRREPGRYLVFAKELGQEWTTASADGRLREIAEAQERERERIARELHDEALQSLLVAGIEIERLMKVAASNESPPGESLVNLQRLLRDVENDIRQLSGRMRCDTVPQCGLLDAVGNAVQTLQTRGFDAELRFWGTPVPVDPNTQILAYRIVQEALHNVLRHSGANRVRTTVVCRHNRLVIRVTDNGSGFLIPPDLAAQGPTEFLGIRGMYERASLMNAQLSIRSRVRMGTTLSLRIPIV